MSKLTLAKFLSVWKKVEAKDRAARIKSVKK